MRTISTKETSNFQGLGESNLEEKGEEIDQSLPTCLPACLGSRVLATMREEWPWTSRISFSQVTSAYLGIDPSSSPIFPSFSLSLPLPFLSFSFSFFFLFFDSSSHQIGYLSAAATLPPSLPRMLSNGKQNGTRFFYRWLDRIRARSRGEEGRACTKCYLLFDGEIRLSRENTLKFDRYGRMGWKVGRIEDGLLFNGNFHSEMMENDSPCNCSTISTISNTPSLCKTQFPKESLSLSLSLSFSLSFLSAHDLPSVIERRGQRERGWHEAKGEDEREKKKAACKRWENEQPLMPVYTWSDPRNLFSEEFTRCTRAHKHILHVYTHQCTWDTRETGFVWLSEPSVGCGSSFNALPSGVVSTDFLVFGSGLSISRDSSNQCRVQIDVFKEKNLNSRTISHSIG